MQIGSGRGRYGNVAAVIGQINYAFLFVQIDYILLRGGQLFCLFFEYFLLVSLQLVFVLLSDFSRIGQLNGGCWC